MRRARQAWPLLIALILAAGVAIGARVAITAGVPEPVTLVVAARTLNPGETMTADLVRTTSVYASSGIRGMIREEELPRYLGGMVLAPVPAGGFIPRAAVRPSGQITTTGRISAMMGRGEQLLVLPLGDRVQGPPPGALVPGDCLDLVAFFPAPTERMAVSEGPAIGGAITATAPITAPQRPLAKWLARVVVRSVLGLPPPVRASEGGAAAPVSTGSTHPRLLVAVPEAAVEGIAYALGAAEAVHLVVAPPCAQAEIRPSPGFSDEDLAAWFQAGRTAAGPPAFFAAPSPTPTPTGGP